MSLKVYDLSHVFTQFMPEWPSSPSVNIDVIKFHARDGVVVLRGLLARDWIDALAEPVAEAASHSAGRRAPSIARASNWMRAWFRGAMDQTGRRT